MHKKISLRGTVGLNARKITNANEMNSPLYFAYEDNGLFHIRCKNYSAFPYGICAFKKFRFSYSMFNRAGSGARNRRCRAAPRAKRGTALPKIFRYPL